MKCKTKNLCPKRKEAKSKKTFTVAICLIKSYHVTVEAKDGFDALGKVSDMGSTEIEKIGSLKNVESDYAEII